MKSLKLLCFIMFLLSNSLVFGKNVGDSNKNSVGGYIHTYWKYDFREDKVPNNEFNIRRAQVEFKNTISNNLSTRVEIDCEKNQIGPKDVFFEYRMKPFLNFVVGQHKIPFSREELRPTDELLVVNRGETNEIFSNYGYLGRDIGVSLTGGIFKNKIDYTFGVFNGNGCMEYGDNNNVKQFGERIVFTPLNSLSIGLNSTQKNDSLSGKVISAYGGDFLYQKSRITLEGEILSGKYLRLLKAFADCKLSLYSGASKAFTVPMLSELTPSNIKSSCVNLW